MIKFLPVNSVSQDPQLSDHDVVVARPALLPVVVIGPNGNHGPHSLLNSTVRHPPSLQASPLVSCLTLKPQISGEALSPFGPSGWPERPQKRHTTDFGPHFPAHLQPIVQNKKYRHERARKVVPTRPTIHTGKRTKANVVEDCRNVFNGSLCRYSTRLRSSADPSFGQKWQSTAEVLCHVGNPV